MSLLLNLQCSLQIIHLTRTTPNDSQCSHLPALPDSEQQLDSALERLALKPTLRYLIKKIVQSIDRESSIGEKFST